MSCWQGVAASGRRCGPALRAGAGCSTCGDPAQVTCTAMDTCSARPGLCSSVSPGATGVNPLGPTELMTGLESPTTSPGIPPEIYSDDPQMLAAAQRDVGTFMTRMQAALRAPPMYGVSADGAGK